MPVLTEEQKRILNQIETTDPLFRDLRNAGINFGDLVARMQDDDAYTQANRPTLPDPRWTPGRMIFNLTDDQPQWVRKDGTKWVNGLGENT